MYRVLAMGKQKQVKKKKKKKKKKKTWSLPEPVQRTVTEIEARGEDSLQHERCFDTPVLKEFKSQAGGKSDKERMFQREQCEG